MRLFLAIAVAILCSLLVVPPDAVAGTPTLGTGSAKTPGRVLWQLETPGYDVGFRWARTILSQAGADTSAVTWADTLRVARDVNRDGAVDSLGASADYIPIVRTDVTYLATSGDTLNLAWISAAEPPDTLWKVQLLTSENARQQTFWFRAPRLIVYGGEAGAAGDFRVTTYHAPISE